MTNGSLTVRIPGSTANLGPGFDTLGLALSIYNEFTFHLLDQNDPAVPLIDLKGPATESLPNNKFNLAYETLSGLWQNRQDLLLRLRISIYCGIPLSRGLGSSSTAILAATWAAHVLAGQLPDRKKILSQAAASEGHPDNLAASLLGGLVICSQSPDNRQHILTQKLDWPEQWHTILVVPPYPLSTRESRLLLPRRLSRQDAVSNLQQVALLVSAVANKDKAALQEALHDQLHEPYRQHLVPELTALRKELRGTGALGCVLSGAGPSVLVIVDRPKHSQLLEHLNRWASKQESPPEILDLKVDKQGLREIHPCRR